jgi:hypothetical protein
MVKCLRFNQIRLYAIPRNVILPRPTSSKMVSVSRDWFETPGSAILFARQEHERPDLMHQQGLYSGKTVGDLDSVPGFYGGTKSYKWVQNTRATTQHRIVRVKRGLEGDEERIMLTPTLGPSAARIAAYKHAKAISESRPTLRGPAQGPKIKYAGEFGGFPKPQKGERPGTWKKVMKNGKEEWIYTPHHPYSRYSRRGMLVVAPEAAAGAPVGMAAPPVAVA